MKNVLVLGANEGLAKVVIPVLLDNPEINLTLFSRNISQLKKISSDRVTIIQGDVMNLSQLNSVMRGQNIVYANLAGDLEGMAKNIVKVMNKQNIKRLIWVSSMGIYSEAGEDFGAILDPYRHSAEIVESSNLDYTIIRPGWFIDSLEINYHLTRKGEDFKGHQVSKLSIATLIYKLIEKPEYAIGESLGIAKV